MKIDEVRAKNDHELSFELDKLKKELFDLRFKSATQALPDSARIRTVRRAIARLNTVLSERSLKIRGQEPR